MAEIPEEIRRKNFRLVKIQDREKGPFEKKWQVENNYRPDDPEILSWNGNYGVVCGYGDLAVIDCDRQEIADRITDGLPETLIVRTGGGGLHFYYIIPDLDEPIRLSDEKPGDIGDVQWHGKQVVGPGSTHPNGRKYEIEHKAEIAEISKEDLERTIGKWVVGTKKSKRWEDPVFKQEIGHIPIDAVVSLGRLKRRGDEYFGEHPVHGSTTGRNFWVNTRKDVFHCFRHDSGGGPLLWLAVREGIISCEEAEPGALQDPDRFSKVLNVAEEEGLIERPEAKTKDRSTWRFGPIRILVERSRNGWVFRFTDLEGETVGRKLDVPEDKGLNDYYQSKLKSRLSEPFECEIIKGPEDFNFRKAFIKLVIEMEDRLPTGGRREPEEAPAPDEGEEDLEREAEEWLQSPHLLTKISEVIHEHLAGETKNSLFLFLVYLSTLTDSPNVLHPVGESAIGKSFLVTRVARLLPDRMKIIRKGFSKMAVWNRAEPTDKEDQREWNLDGKVMIILEEETAEDFLKQFRPILSHDEHKITYEVTDTESKERRTLKVDIEGWPAYIGVRVGGLMDEQEETRSMFMSPYAGREKYSKSIQWDARKDAEFWKEPARKEKTKVARRTVELLEKYRVFIPYITEIQKYFPKERARHMRDWKQFKGLIKAVTILHQYQRPRIKLDDQEVLVSAPTDLEVACIISEDALNETLRGIGPREQRLWRHLCEKAEETGYLEGYRSLLTAYEECFREPVSETTLRRKYIRKFEDKGLMEVEKGGGSKGNKYFPVGKLSTLYTNFGKLVSAAKNCDFKDTELFNLYRTTTSPQTTPPPTSNHNNIYIDLSCAYEDVKEGFLNLTNCYKNIDKHKDSVKKGLEDLWGYACGLDLVRYNEKALATCDWKKHGGEKPDENLVYKVDKFEGKKGSNTLDAWTEKPVSAVRSGIRDLLLGIPLTMDELLANFDKSEWDRVGNVINKMAENGEIFKDADDRWRLANE